MSLNKQDSSFFEMTDWDFCVKFNFSVLLFRNTVNVVKLCLVKNFLTLKIFKH